LQTDRQTDGQLTCYNHRC